MIPKMTFTWTRRKGIVVFPLLIYFAFVLFTYARQGKSHWIAAYVTIFSIAWLALTLIYILEVTKSHRLSHHQGRWFRVAFLILVPALSFLMIEIMVSNYNPKMFLQYGIFNLAWYYVVVFLFYAVLRNARRTVILSNLFLYLAGVLNYLVYLFRGNPIIPSDLLAWQTGMSVASNYQVSFSLGFVLATILMYFILVIGSKLEDGQAGISALNRIAGIVLYSALTAVVFLLFFRTDLIQSKIKVLDFFAPKYTYCAYGTVFGFVANVEAMEAEAPEGYTTDIVKELLTNAEAEPVLEASQEVKPNIIAIMNEAFSDLSMIGDYETNRSYRPYTSTLEENTTKGTLYTSVFGGATSDTEYEFLTGNSMAVMPQNCVPYQQFITSETDSLAATLKAQGYYNIAIHPYAPSGYKRDLVYPLLGFDEFLSKENFENPQMIRSYISDRESYKMITRQYEEQGDQPLFIFNVTMQNHGGYSEERVFDEEETVRLTQLSGHPKVEQYLSLLRESDKALQYLVDYFSKEEEPTIILLFGDHQPVVFAALPNRTEGKQGMTLSELDRHRYAVPFMVWANYDITEDDVDNISANYLSSYLLRIAELPGTTYNEYLLQLQKELPVINAHFYITKEGDCYSLSEETVYSTRLKQYQYVGYNNALDKKGKLWSYYHME